MAGQAEGFDPQRPLHPADPPACPPGWHTGPPDFVGVGAQRSGTTWWHRLIVAHPGVCHDRDLHTKEVHFFDALGDRPLMPEEARRYHLYFPRPGEGGVVGEWTPRYMQDPWVPRQLASAAPEARVLILLRDPVDRFASGFARARRLAAERGVTGIDAELAERHAALGMYAAQVAAVLDAFPRERVLVLQYERCRADHAGELRRTYEFLGLDTAGGAGAGQPPREPRERSLAAPERQRLAALYAPDVRKLIALVPDVDPSLWPSVAGLL